MPRSLTLAACIVCVSAVLSGCSSLPTAAPAAQELPPETWRNVYAAIFTASSASQAEAESSARTAMQDWIDKVRQRTEADFVPWYCDYWTQQWLELKAAWYQANHTEGGASSAEQLASYLQSQYDDRVVEPVREEIDPDKLMDEAASAYLRTLRERIRSVQERYHLPAAQLEARLDRIQAIVPEDDPGRGASLNRLLQADDITRVAAYAALAASIRRASGSTRLRPLADRLRAVAAPTADKAARRLATQGAAAAASSALGGVGILLGIGVSMWGAIDYSKTRPALEAELRRQLRSGLDAAWTDTLARLDDTVLGPMHRISSNIDAGLLFPQTD